MSISRRTIESASKHAISEFFRHKIRPYHFCYTLTTETTTTMTRWNERNQLVTKRMKIFVDPLREDEMYIESSLLVNFQFYYTKYTHSIYTSQ